MFNPPIFDDSRNLSQWIRHVVETSPEHPVFSYASSGSLSDVTWSKFGNAVERAAVIVNSLFELVPTDKGEDRTAPKTIGILASLDSITYHAIQLGILRAGGVAFFISTRNSAVAVSHLLKKTQTTNLLVSPDEPTQALMRAAVNLVSSQGHQVFVCTTPTFHTLFEEESDVRFSQTAGLDAPLDAPSVILHSSGSTSFPKPVVLTHRVVLQWSRFAGILGMDNSRQRLAAHSLPVYHAMGFYIIFWAARTGITLCVFPPRIPPIVSSPASFLEAAVASSSTFMFCVPIFIEIWSHDQDAIDKLKKFTGIIFGGGLCNPRICDEMERRGVHLMSSYGATEVGPVSIHAPRERDDHGWEWMQLSPLTNGKFLPQDDPDTFELAFVEGPTHTLLISNTTLDGKRGYATNDVIIKHPTDPLKFKIHGRKDDQIILSSGEKTNPGPIEHIICADPLIKTAVVFGRGRDRNGVLIQPEKDHEFDPTDPDKLSRFRNDIWPSIERANEFAPSHSRLFKEMILVTYPEKPVEMTAKHDPRRSTTVEVYKSEIESAYNAVEDSTRTDLKLPVAWNFSEVMVYVRELVHKVLNREIEDEADIFVHGGDSLGATYIRNSLVYVVRKARKSAVGGISQNFVYANPTILGLARRLQAIIIGAPGADGDEISANLREMEKEISDSSAHFPEHRGTDSPRVPSGEIILLTGSTGGLGSQLLAHLVTRPDVSRIYALNRRSKQPLRMRQEEALIGRGLDGNIISSPKVVLVEGDTAVDGLDIEPQLYEEIRDNITLVIHNAWKVNFNLTFRTFKSNVKGVRNLIHLCLASPHQHPPRIIYISSVSVFRNHDSERGRPLEAPVADLSVALGMGYSESKLVSERVLENAARTTPLRPIIVRVGQMTGTASGAWNSGDWLPAIVRSGQVVGALPNRSDTISWLPLETAAQAIFEFRHSESQYLHLAHPNPALWSTVFDEFSSRLRVPLVTWTEWLAKLEKSDGGSARNPAATYLLDFFRRCSPVALKNREATGALLMDLTQALACSPSLSSPSLPQIGRDDAELWLKHWTATRFLNGFEDIA